MKKLNKEHVNHVRFQFGTFVLSHSIDSFHHSTLVSEGGMLAKAARKVPQALCERFDRLSLPVTYIIVNLKCLKYTDIQTYQMNWLALKFLYTHRRLTHFKCCQSSSSLEMLVQLFLSWILALGGPVTLHPHSPDTCHAMKAQLLCQF